MRVSLSRVTRQKVLFEVNRCSIALPSFCVRVLYYVFFFYLFINTYYNYGYMIDNNNGAAYSCSDVPIGFLKQKRWYIRRKKNICCRFLLILKTFRFP